MAKAKFNSEKSGGGSVGGDPPNLGDGAAYFTIAQLALRWLISERQVHRFIVSGELTATHFGRAVRISADEVARFEAAQFGAK